VGQAVAAADPAAGVDQAVAVVDPAAAVDQVAAAQAAVAGPVDNP
jgi:hypothetical protein